MGDENSPHGKPKIHVMRIYARAPARRLQRRRKSEGVQSTLHREKQELGQEQNQERRLKDENLRDSKIHVMGVGGHMGGGRVRAWVRVCICVCAYIRASVGVFVCVWAGVYS